MERVFKNGVSISEVWEECSQDPCSYQTFRTKDGARTIFAMVTHPEDVVTVGVEVDEGLITRVTLEESVSHTQRGLWVGNRSPRIRKCQLFKPNYDLQRSTLCCENSSGYWPVFSDIRESHYRAFHEEVLKGFTYLV